MSKILLLSTSSVHSTPYLEYCTPLLEQYYSGIKELLFIPYARPSGLSWEEYTAKCAARFRKMDISVVGAHHIENNPERIKDFGAVFIGGGNTFLLLNDLYKFGMVDTIHEAVLSGDIQYMGTSAGSNIGGLTINTTNDMPIVYPPSFSALGLVGYNLNPHYIDPDPSSKHMGETRATRIAEFHSREDNSQAVVGLREGSGLLIQEGKTILTGDLSARIFEQGKKPYEISPDEDFPDL
jgi:dipeptidase E